MDVTSLKNNRSLYIYCHPSFNSFFVYDNSLNEWIVTSCDNIHAAQSKWPDILELKAWLSRNITILNNPFEEVIIAIDSKNYLMVPPDLEENKKHALVAEFTQVDEKETIFLSQIIDNSEFIYSIDKAYWEILDHHFEKKEVIFGDTGVIQFAKKNSGKLVAQIFEEHLSIAFYDNNKLQFYNTFTCNHVNDYLYFLLLAFETLQIDPHYDTLLIGGMIEKNGSLYNEISNFIDFVEIVKLNINYDHETPAHYFFNILNLQS